MGLPFEPQEVILTMENHVAGSTPSLPVDRERQVIETRPLSESARTGQKTNSPSKQIKENPAFSKASLQSAGTVEGGAGIGGSAF